MDIAELEREIEELRDTLRETEEVCRAIKRGEVDAVVVGPDDEAKRVLLMSGAYARYRQIVEDMAQGAVTVTPNGEILFANHSFAAMVGEALVDVFRTPFTRWLAPADHGALDALLSGLAGVRDVEVMLVRKDRSAFPVRLSLVTASDDFATLLVSPRNADLEEAKATLEAIRNGALDGLVIGDSRVVLLDSAQALYRTVVEHMRQGAVTVDAAGVVTYVNERFSAMAGMPHGHLIGVLLEDLVAESDRATYRLIAAGNDSAQGELRLRRKHGNPPVMQVTMASLDAQRLFLFTDITQRKRHEASDERVRKFLGMLAHEFRNILGPIGNAAEILKRTQALDADGKKAVELIERQNARLLGLVEDLRRINPPD
jgi:PAS domain S-box-containing protein